MHLCICGFLGQDEIKKGGILPSHFFMFSDCVFRPFEPYKIPHFQTVRNLSNSILPELFLLYQGEQPFSTILNFKNRRFL